MRISRIDLHHATLPYSGDRIADAMDGVLTGHNDAKTALDVACWDAFGRSVGLPVSELLGGSTRTPMPVMSSIPALDPEDMRARVADHRARGYRGHSVKVGALDRDGGPALDAERVVASLADRRPGEYFTVDANGGLTVEAALRMIELLPRGLDITLEAPCATWRETTALRRRCRYPIVLDELAQQDGDVALVVAGDLADGNGLKISKAGGLTHGRRQRDVCRAAGLTIAVQDTVGSSIAYAAIIQLGATVPEHLLRCVLDVEDMVTLRTARLHARVTGDGVVPTDSPGLGITVDRDAVGSPRMSWGD